MPIFLWLQLGPRLRLQLVKIEEGMCSGEVLFHEYGENLHNTVYLLSKRTVKFKIKPLCFTLTSVILLDRFPPPQKKNCLNILCVVLFFVSFLQTLFVRVSHNKNLL